MKAFFFGLLMLAVGWARAGQLVVLVATSVDMPMADIRDGKLQGGIHRDLAEALAQRMQRELVISVLPRKRLAMALEAGRGDVLCTYLPAWVEGQHDWTQPFFPQSELLLTARQGPQPRSLGDVRGQPVGTVLGFAYPEMDQALGPDFVRSDAGSALGNLHKFQLGRVRHIIIDKAFLDYQRRQGEKVDAYPALVIKYQLTRCAVSRRGQVSVEEVDAAITQMLKHGIINKILSNYQ